MMKVSGKGALMAAVAFVLAIVLLLVSFASIPSPGGRGIEDAPPFSGTDQEGNSVELSDLAGNVTVLHFTQLEYPLCIECEGSIVAQLRELEALVGERLPNLTVVTVNLRKNSYSDPGWLIAERDYGINITWSWIEDEEPYVAANGYLDYWQYQGGLSNPTILLIDGGSRVVGTYHVYVVGRGEVDDVRSRSDIVSNYERIMSGEWGDEMEGSISTMDVGYWSMFMLGALTSFSPCSLALLLTMILYIGSTNTGGREGRSANKAVMNLGLGTMFTLGVALTFLVIGFLIGYLSEFLAASTAFYVIGGAVLLVLGINTIWPIRRLLGGSHWEEGCACEVSKGRFGTAGRRLLSATGSRSRLVAGFSLGALFSLGWLPCALSLVFPMILIIIAQGLPVLETGLLMFVFGLGHGLVIVPLTLTSGEVQRRIQEKYENASGPIRFGFGVAIIAMGALFVARYWGYYLW